MCALLSSHARRSAEFKATLAGGLAADWENKEVQKLATEHYNEMDKMGNANGLLEVRRRCGCVCSYLWAQSSRVSQMNEWLNKVIANGKDQTDAEFEESLEAWTQLINHKRTREEKSCESAPEKAAEDA